MRQDMLKKRILLLKNFAILNKERAHRLVSKQKMPGSLDIS
jgi:hypothetical protein